MNYTFETTGGSGMKSDADILYATQIAKKGIAKGHNIELDDVTLDQIVELGNAAKNGIKTRFGHPSMCTPGVGTAIGRRKNFRRSNNYVIADLHFASGANPEYKRHILELAKNDPDLIGSSVVVTGTELAREGTDSDGEPLLPVLRVTQLAAVDIVDDPASGDGLFGAPIEGISLSAREMVGIKKALDNAEFVERALAVLQGRAKALGLTVKALNGDKPVNDAIAERNRVAAILEVSEGHPHLATPTKEFPKGLQRHALESGMTESEFLRHALALANRAATLHALELESDLVEVASCDFDAKSLRGATLAESFAKRFESLGYDSEKSRQMAESATKGAF